MITSRAKLVFILAILLSACKEDDSDFSQTLDIHTFTIESPPGWVLKEGMGFDSYVGVIEGPAGTIHYDQGLFSFPGLDKIVETDQTIYLRHMTVNGSPAVLRKERLPETNTDADVRLSLYIEAEDPWHRNHLYVNDPTPFGESILIEIMKTHRFKE